MQNNRKLHHLKGFRVQIGNGPPKPSEGVDGDLTVRLIRSGLKLFVKFKNRWYTLSSGGDLGVPGGSNTEEVLSVSDLRPIESKGRGQETFVNSKTKNLEVGGNIKLNKSGFINRDGVSEKGLYFGRDDLAKPGQAYFDDDLFIQLGRKLVLSDGEQSPDSDGQVSSISAPLDQIVEMICDGTVFLQLDSTANDRVKLTKKLLLGDSGYMTLNDNSIDVSNGNLALNAAGDITATVSGGQFTIKDDGIADPDLIIESTSNDGFSGGIIMKKLGRAGANNDYVGYINFTGLDTSSNSQNYAGIFARVDVGTHGQESGRLELDVANHDGGTGTGLKLTGGSANDEIDVEIGLGASSLTTVKGKLAAGGDAKYDNLVVKSDAANNAIEMGGEDGNSSQIILYEAGGTSTADFLSIFVEEDGVSTISTTDGGGAAAHLNVIADGNMDLNIAGNLTIDVDGGQARLTDDSETDNVFTPAHDADIATKKYVDDNAGGGGYWIQVWNARAYTRNLDWFHPHHQYGVAYYNWTYDTNSTSLPSTLTDDKHPLIVVPKDCTLKEYNFTGSFTGAQTYEVALMKGTGVTFGSAGNWSLSQVGATQSQVVGTANVQHTLGQEGLSVSLSKGDTLVPVVRRSTTDTSAYHFFELAFSIVCEVG